MLFRSKETLTILVNGEERSFARKAASIVKPLVDMDGVQDVDLTDDETEPEA